jgi:hypothetical protein
MSVITEPGADFHARRELHAQRQACLARQAPRNGTSGEWTMRMETGIAIRRHALTSSPDILCCGDVGHAGPERRA